MFSRLAAVILSGFVIAGPAQAEERAPVVVELFTSQGCSSCPAADEVLAMLADRPQVLPLALHVDYWDYLGWKDSFAQPGFTKRQKAYAKSAGRKMIYTPQMIIAGGEALVGNHPMEVSDAIMDEMSRPSVVQVALRREGGALLATADPLPPGASEGPLMVQLVEYDPLRRVEIVTGENAGQIINYANVVTRWEHVADWDGRSPLRVEIAPNAGAEGAVLIQRRGPGRILGAARLP